MRKLMSVMVVISGLALGCGSDDGKADNNATSGNGNGNGGSNGENSGDSNGIDIPDDMSGGGEKYPECKAREDIPAMFTPWAGTKMMTAAQFMACQTKCGMDETCFNETNCPGFDSFNDCLNTEVLGCAAAEGGKCRTEYENVECCAEKNNCSATDANCAMAKCMPDIDAFSNCATGDRTCIQKGFQGCVAPAMLTTPGSSASANAAATISSADVVRTLQMLRSAR